jgi:hypothetical protein
MASNRAPMRSGRGEASGERRAAGAGARIDAAQVRCKELVPSPRGRFLLFDLVRNDDAAVVIEQSAGGARLAASVQRHAFKGWAGEALICDVGAPRVPIGFAVDRHRESAGAMAARLLLKFLEVLPNVFRDRLLRSRREWFTRRRTTGQKQGNYQNCSTHYNPQLKMTSAHKLGWTKEIGKRDDLSVRRHGRDLPHPAPGLGLTSPVLPVQLGEDAMGTGTR